MVFVKLPLIKFASLISVITLATTACAQSNEGVTSNQNIENVEKAGTISQSIDSHLRQVLT